MPRRRFLDRFLFLVEICAVVGLIIIVINGIGLIRKLNAEVASAMKNNEPLVGSQASVLPSGHTPPGAPGGARPDGTEVSDSAKLATPSLEQAIWIKIPVIGVDAPVVQGDSWELLKKGVGQHIGSGNPGQTGNLVLSAHDDVFGEIFRDLHKLVEGDEVTILTQQNQYVYKVTANQIVNPDQTEVMDPTTTATVTLITCYPYLIDTKRVVVTAELE